MPSRSKGKRGRQQSPLRPYKVYPHVFFDPRTEMFIVRVRGHEEVADHDSTALQVRAEMFEKYAGKRPCNVCGKDFIPERNLKEMICSDECKRLKQARNWGRNQKVFAVDRYLYRRGRHWVGEPWSALHNKLLRAFFDTEEEAREHIEAIMRNTRPERLRECNSCKRMYDFYEEGLRAKPHLCRDCGGVPYVLRTSKRKIPPAETVCQWCKKTFPWYGKGPAARYCDDCRQTTTRVERDCIRCGVSVFTSNGRHWAGKGAALFCDSCRSETTHWERTKFVREHLAASSESATSAGSRTSSGEAGDEPGQASEASKEHRVGLGRAAASGDAPEQAASTAPS